MTSLTVHTCCQYLTTGDKWRDEDWNARVIIKSVKGEPFNGYFDIQVDGVRIRLDQTNMDVGLDKAGMIMASRLLELIDFPVTLVPVPNSHACIGTAAEFRTLLLARAIAKYSNGIASASPAILWKKPKNKQHQGGGYRHASHFIGNLEITRRVTTPVVLIDDVITSGSQMLACTYLFRKARVEVPFGMAVGRTTQVQTPDALKWVSGEIMQMIL